MRALIFSKVLRRPGTGTPHRFPLEVKSTLPVLHLRPNADRRLRVGHAWIFSNEVDTGRSAMTELSAGQLVSVANARGKAIGTAYFNPKTLIAGRMLSSRFDARIDDAWMTGRIRTALESREADFNEPCYRLVYGESDGLPGLVVDRFDNVLVVQIATAGMEALKSLVVEALTEILAPSGILIRNDLPMRNLEGLASAENEVIGQIPDSLQVMEAGLKFQVPARSGQKTGWFFDQRDNRDRLARYAKGKCVLDVFSYVGAWGVRALSAGASDVTCVDRSAAALSLASANAQLNGHELGVLEGEALDVLKDLRTQGRIFDVVIVDPPALIKRKKDHSAGFEHYAALNRAAMHLLAPGGVLISCSCSQHLMPEELQRLLLRESRSQNRQLQILESGGQGPDHPVHPAIPESRYLKALFCRVR